MPGRDPARSSWASEHKVEAVLRPIWHRKIGPHIPSKVQIIYACWLYAREFGGAEEVLARMASRIQAPPFGCSAARGTHENSGKTAKSAGFSVRTDEMPAVWKVPANSASSTRFRPSR